MTGRELLAIVAEHLASPRFAALLPEGQQFLNETARYFYVHAAEIEVLELLEMAGGTEALRVAAMAAWSRCLARARWISAAALTGLRRQARPACCCWTR